jgi:hypothetical protein
MQNRERVNRRRGFVLRDGVSLLLVLIASGQIAPANAQKELNTAYEAVVKGGKRGDTTLLDTTISYDRGRYSIQNGDRILVCDNASPPARWFVDMKTKTAQLDFQFVILQVLDRVKKDGAESTAGRLHVDRSLLNRFVQQNRSYMARDLDHILLHVNPSAPGFLRNFERAGSEKVAEKSCDLYHSRADPDRTIWVDSSSRYVLKERTVYPSGDPRIPPRLAEMEVIHFQILPSIDPARLQIPAGVTAILPHFLAELALPTGVKRQLITGNNGMLGFDIKQLVDDAERRERLQGHPQKAIQ